MDAREQKGRATVAALLEAARAEFGAQGYSDTSLERIVHRASVTKGAFYHHFSGKQELFLRVFEEIKRELSRAAFVTHLDHEPFAAKPRKAQTYSWVAEQSNAEIWQQLLERCRRYVELHTAPHVSRIALIDAPWVLPWDERKRIEREYGVVLLRADLRRAMQRGLVHRLPLGTLAAILAGALNEACLLVAHAPENEPALDEAMTVIQRLLEGLKAA
jgi:AcrR family transcriptional regulator